MVPYNIFIVGFRRDSVIELFLPNDTDDCIVFGRCDVLGGAAGRSVERVQCAREEAKGSRSRGGYAGEDAFLITIAFDIFFLLSTVRRQVADCLVMAISIAQMTAGG